MIRVLAEKTQVGDRVTLSTSQPTVQANDGGTLTFTDGRTMRLAGMLVWVHRPGLSASATAEHVREAVAWEVVIAIEALERAAKELPPFDLARGGNTDAAHLRLSRAIAQLVPLTRRQAGEPQA